MMFTSGFKHNFTCSNENALLNPAFGTWLETSAGSPSKENASLVCIEDADNYLKKREAHNTQMSALLSYTDGIVQKASKLVISTNLKNVNDVDEALLRSGRTFRVVRFRALTHDEANNARAALELPPIAVKDERKDWYLSDALNYVAENHANSNNEREATGFGFISK